MYCVAKESNPPGWRSVAACTDCTGDEYCAPSAPTDDWVWDAALESHRAPTNAEVLAGAKAAKAASLAASLKPYFESQWSDVERFTADYPTVANEAFVAAYGAHRLACSQAVAAAIAVANAAATVEAVNSVAIVWPATPEKPQ